MATATMTSKGQMTVPASSASGFGSARDRLDFVVNEQGDVVVRPTGRYHFCGASWPPPFEEATRDDRGHERVDPAIARATPMRGIDTNVLVRYLRRTTRRNQKLSMRREESGGRRTTAARRRHRTLRDGLVCAPPTVENQGIDRDVLGEDPKTSQFSFDDRDLLTRARRTTGMERATSPIT